MYRIMDRLSELVSCFEVNRLVQLVLSGEFLVVVDIQVRVDLLDLSFWVDSEGFEEGFEEGPEGLEKGPESLDEDPEADFGYFEQEEGCCTMLLL